MQGWKNELWDCVYNLVTAHFNFWPRGRRQILRRGRSQDDARSMKTIQMFYPDGMFYSRIVKWRLKTFFFLLLTPCCQIQKLSWLWQVQPRPPFVLVSDFSLLNPPPPLFLDQNLDNTGPTKLLPRWSPSRSLYSSSSWSPSTWSSTSCLVINIMIIMIRRLMENIMKNFQFFSTLPICQGPICQGLICHTNIFKGPNLPWPYLTGPSLPKSGKLGPKKCGAQFATLSARGPICLEPLLLTIF